MKILSLSLNVNSLQSYAFSWQLHRELLIDSLVYFDQIMFTSMLLSYVASTISFCLNSCTYTEDINSIQVWLSGHGDILTGLDRYLVSIPFLPFITLSIFHMFFLVFRWKITRKCWKLTNKVENGKKVFWTAFGCANVHIKGKTSYIGGWVFLFLFSATGWKRARVKIAPPSFRTTPSRTRRRRQTKRCSDRENIVTIFIHPPTLQSHISSPFKKSLDTFSLSFFQFSW